jgi:hypothetical protein
MAAVFLILLVVASVTLDHAINHAAFLTKFANGDYFQSSVPKIGDAVQVFLFGPVLQLVVFGALFAVISRRRRRVREWLGPVSWIMLVFDVLFAVVVLALTESAIAI